MSPLFPVSCYVVSGLHSSYQKAFLDVVSPFQSQPLLLTPSTLQCNSMDNNLWASKRMTWPNQIIHFLYLLHQCRVRFDKRFN